MFNMIPKSMKKAMSWAKGSQSTPRRISVYSSREQLKIAHMKTLDANLTTYIQMSASLEVNMKDTCVSIDTEMK